MTPTPTTHLHAVSRDADATGGAYNTPVGEQTWCEANSHIFITLLNAPPKKSASQERHDDYERYTTMARDWCSRRCHRFEACLYEALAGHGMDGFVAGTTETERKRLREVTGLTPTPIDMDFAAGVKPKVGAAYDVDATAAAIAANPQATNSEIAARLGISPVTVKRHRRKIQLAAEAEKSAESTTPAEAVEAYHDMFRSA